MEPYQNQILPFALSLSKGRPFMVRQAHHERPVLSSSKQPALSSSKRTHPMLTAAVTGSGLAQALGILIAMAALFLASSTASAASAPGAPVGLVVAPGNGKLIAGWQPPQGDAEITSYTVQYIVRGATSDYVTASHSGTGTDAEITGLTNSVSYSVRVRASNSVGDGPWSATASATPHEDVVWAAILTVGKNQRGGVVKYQNFGCQQTFWSHDETWPECSVALTEDEFEFAGVTYRWVQLEDDAGDGSDMVSLTPYVPTDSPLRKGKMQLGDHTVFLDNPDHVSWFKNNSSEMGGTRDSRKEDGFVLYHPSLVDVQNWVEGQKVPLSLQAVVSSGEPQAQAIQGGGIEDWCPGSQTPATEGINVCHAYTYEGQPPISILIKLPSPAPAGGAIVNIATGLHQTASSDDFTLSTTALAIAEGETSGILTITATVDDEDEGDESIHVYVCASPGCDPLNPGEGEKVYNHGFKIIGTRKGGL